jgi:toxin FitB
MMDYLLDTCVLSEFTRRKPEEKVIRWLDGIEEEKLFLSVITVGEIQHGIEKLPASTRKNELQTWMNDRLVARFGERILPLDTQTLLRWGTLTASMERSGQPLPVMDGLIIATAMQHNLIIATRNVADFQPCGVLIINPWE